MAEYLLRCSCPECGNRLGIKDRRLIGRRIKCPKCQELFLVEAPAQEDDEEVASARDSVPAEDDYEDEVIEDAPKRTKKTRNDDDSDDDQEEADEDDRPRGKRRGDNGDDEDRPRKKKKKTKQKSGAMVWILAGGGVVALGALALVLVVVLSGNKGDGTDKGPGTAVVLGGNKGGGTDKGPDTPAELLVDVSGAWPEPKIAFGLWPDSLTFRTAMPGITHKTSGREAVAELEEAISDRLGALVGHHYGPGSATGSVGASNDEPGGRGRRMISRFSNVKEDADVIAKKIDFGTVRSVQGRIITLVVSKIEGLPPPTADAVTKALFQLRSPNSRRRETAAKTLMKQQPDQRAPRSRRRWKACCRMRINAPGSTLPRASASGATRRWCRCCSSSLTRRSAAHGRAGAPFGAWGNSRMCGPFRRLSKVLRIPPRAKTPWKP